MQNISPEEEKFLKEVQKEEAKESIFKREKKEKRKTSATLIFATTIILFLIVVVLLIFVMSVGGAGNPILQFFGQNEDSIKDFLLSLSNGVFGTFSVVLLFSIAIGLFVGFAQPKGDKSRVASFVFAVVAFFLQFFIILVWLGMYNYISSLAATQGVGKGEIILIMPNGKKIMPPITKEETISLVTPVDLDFSLEMADDYFERRGNKVIGVQWDFSGQGFFENITQDLKRTQRFLVPGKKNITVKFLLKNGNEVIKKMSFDIPQGTFSTIPNTGNVPIEIKIDAKDIASSIKNIDSFEWDLDGDFIFEKKGTEISVNKTFSVAGNHTINLKIVTKDGAIHKFTKTINLSDAKNNNIIPQIETTPIKIDNNILSVNINEKIQFNAKNSVSNNGEIKKYEWIFNDGSKKLGGIIDHKFEKEGSFEVVLKITNENNISAEKTIKIIVSQDKKGPIAKLITKPKYNEKNIITGENPLTIDFDASSSEFGDGSIVDYEWDFDSDDVVDARGSKVKYTFRNSGNYDVILKVIDSNNNFSILNLKVNVLKKILQAKIKASPDTAELPCDIEFDGSLSECAEEGCNIIAYEWDFDDGKGGQIKGAKAFKRFAKVGQYDIGLKVFTNKNTNSEITKTVFCRETQLKSCFQASRSEGENPLTVSFDSSCSTGVIKKWKWDFGDGKISEYRSPTHTFYEKGNHTVTLTTIDEENNISKYQSEITVF